MLKALVVKWNRDRGLLDNYDPSLELRMLSEEAREFYMAETLAHMLAERADFEFVLYGTQAKFGSQKISSHVDMPLYTSTYTDIIDWAEAVAEDMDRCLESALGPMCHETAGLIRLALDVVVQCNNRKGKNKSAGKVVKIENPPDPVALIQEQLDRLGF